MPVLLNVLLGVPQMLSNIQMILICVAVCTNSYILCYACSRSVSPRRPTSCPRSACASSRQKVDCSPARHATCARTASRTSACCCTRTAFSVSSSRSALCLCPSSPCRPHSSTSPADARRFLHAGHSGISRSMACPSHRWRANSATTRTR